MSDDSLFFGQHFSQDFSLGHWEASCVGHKAAELAKLPPDWTPSFFVLPADRDATTADLEVAISRLSSKTIELVVRSSATDESLYDRGKYHSFRSSARATEVQEYISQIRTHFDGLNKSPTTPTGMAIVVQLFIPPKRYGHLSNERRVSREITSWHLEWQHSERDLPSVRTFSTKHKPDISRAALKCGSAAELDACLISLASQISKNRQRVHVEWVWDGTQLWIVQFDRESTLAGQEPGAEWLKRYPPDGQLSLNALLPAKLAENKWPKMKAVQTFEACGLPTTDVYVIDNVDVLTAISQYTVSDLLRSDIERLTQHPVVIRTDYSEKVASSGMLLPRTGAISNADEVIAFLCKTAEKLRLTLAPEHFCFTLHRFIGARGCAFSYSKPGIDKVRIDATWGSPDSLLFYPHDTYEVDSAKRTVISKKIRCKTHYIDMDASGKWEERRSGEPWDWKSALTDDELLEIADSSRRVSQFLNEPIEIMFFVGVAKPSGESYCLPWFSTNKVASHVDSETNVRYAGKRVSIANMDDVAWIEQQLASGTLRKPFNIRLRPQPSVLRSEEFITDVARIAKIADVAIELEGSILSHCYYTLTREGARVTCIDAYEESTTSRVFNKLVRDKIPLRIELHGELPRFLKVTSDEMLQLLKAKAIEESLELFWENDPLKIVEELADILEVIETAGRSCGVTLDDLADKARDKREARGGFNEGIVLLETRSVPLITRELKEVGLFRDEELSVESIAPTRTHYSGFRDTRRPKTDAKGVVISLVPPNGIETRRNTVLQMPDGIHEIEVHYANSEVRIDFRPKSEQHEDPRQLKFEF